MPSRVPLTNLRDENKGGAPLFVNGDQKTATAPLFLDDNDPYDFENYTSRGNYSIVHIPPAGATTVDFVTLFFRNTSTTDKAYVNVVLASNISCEFRIAGLVSASPTFGDVLLMEVDMDTTMYLLETALTNNELSVTVRQSATFDPKLPPPEVVFVPPSNGNLHAVAHLNASGRLQSISVFNATSHSYDAPPTVFLKGGQLRKIGFFENFDYNSEIVGSHEAGALKLVGSLARTDFPSNIRDIGDIILFDSELRVVTSVNQETNEFTIDAGLESNKTDFETWSYISGISISEESLYRLGKGTIRNQVSLGQTAIACSENHHLAVGDYVIYSPSSLPVSRRVVSVLNKNEFVVDNPCLLTATDAKTWGYVYLFSQKNNDIATDGLVRSVSYVKTQTDDGDILDIAGHGNRKLFIQNRNYFNKEGSYFDDSSNDYVLFAKTAINHEQDLQELPHEILPHTILEIELNPQPAPEIQVLAGFPVNGGLATETGRRPVIACYQRGSKHSKQTLFWGYYSRYRPESGTNFTQAINI